jgi:hypothetical protein
MSCGLGGVRTRFRGSLHLHGLLQVLNLLANVHLMANVLSLVFRFGFRDAHMSFSF